MVILADNDPKTYLYNNGGTVGQFYSKQSPQAIREGIESLELERESTTLIGSINGELKVACRDNPFAKMMHAAFGNTELTASNCDVDVFTNETPTRVLITPKMISPR